ncbi:MAG: succinylglutamate desuccinylase/aspartoacylase family protein [Candidatus Thorarchaeota archaeon]|jgi:predicted deacylase
MTEIEDLDVFLGESGTRKFGWLPVSTRSDGSPFGIPVNAVIGKDKGPTLVIEACIHGDETEGTLAALTVLDDLNPDELKGTVISIPVLNIRAYETQTRGNPDERYYYDMNRLFPGNPNGSVSQRFVHVYFSQIVKRADTVIALHGGGALFYLKNRVMISKDPKSIDLAKAMGPEWPLLHESHHPGTLLVECEKEGIAGVIAELGGSNNRLPGPLMENVDCFKRMIKNVMRHLGMIDGEIVTAKEWGVLKGTNVKCEYGGLIIPTEKCRIDTEVKEGDHIVTIVDLFGNELLKVLAPQDGTVLGVPASPVAYPGNNILTIAKVVKKIK